MQADFAVRTAGWQEVSVDPARDGNLYYCVPKETASGSDEGRSTPPAAAEGKAGLTPGGSVRLPGVAEPPTAPLRASVPPPRPMRVTPRPMPSLPAASTSAGADLTTTHPKASPSLTGASPGLLAVRATGAGRPLVSDRPVAPAVFVVELPPAGDLALMEAPRVLGWASTTSYSGCLWMAPFVEGQEAPTPATQDLAPHRELYFETGALIGGFSSLAGDRLVDFLAPMWSRPQLQRARQLLASVPMHRLNEQLNTLAEAQLIPRTQLRAYHINYVRELCCRTATVGPGRYRTLARAITRDERLEPGLPIRRLIVDGLRRSVSLDFLQRRLGAVRMRPRATAVVGAIEGGSVLRGLGLSDAEEQALSLFDGQHSLAEIMQATGIGEHACYVLTYSMICLGTLAVVGTGQKTPPAGRAVAAVPSTSPKASPSLTGPKSSPSIQLNQIELTIRRIQVKARQVEEGDYYALLELPPTASTAEILSSHHALRAEFHPPTLPYRARTSLDRELRQIARVLDEARAVLSHEHSRRLYSSALGLS